MNKDYFITNLKHMTPKEINEFIELKGKKRKLIKPIIRLELKNK